MPTMIISGFENLYLCINYIVINTICQTLKINKDWLVSGIGEIEDNSETSKSAKILAELYDVAKQLSEDEQLYLLDAVKALKRRLGKNRT